MLRAGLGPLVDGRSPVFEAVPDYPKVDPSKLPIFQDLVDTLSSFDAEVEAVRETPGRKAREERTRALQASHGASPSVREAAVLALLRLVRDNLGLARRGHLRRQPARPAAAEPAGDGAAAAGTG